MAHPLGLPDDQDLVVSDDGPRAEHDQPPVAGGIAGRQYVFVWLCSQLFVGPAV